jgi:hypothetical protein
MLVTSNSSVLLRVTHEDMDQDTVTEDISDSEFYLSTLLRCVLDTVLTIYKQSADVAF